MGLILALLYAGYLMVIRSLPTETVYLAATGFLYSWYFWWTIILGVIVGLVALVAIIGGGVAGACEGRGPIGAFGGIVLGGGFSLLIVLVFAIRRTLYVGGAYMLHTALTATSGGYSWDKGRLILGVLLLFVAALTKSRSSSNSDSSS